MSLKDDEFVGDRIGDDSRQISLCETLDRVLNKGVVLAGEVVISVADVELIYLNLRVLLTSVDTVERHRHEARMAALAAAGGAR